MRAKRALGLLSLAVLLSACAPPQAENEASSADKMTGTLQVWLFSEVNQEPKEKIVNAAIEEFESAHDDVTVEVQYIPVKTRNERFKAAFSDPSSAPDVAEYGNTDLAGYVEAGGFADIGDDIADWESRGDIADDVMATAQVDGKTYGVPWFLGVRALYYRTDIFEELDLKAPETLKEVAEAGRKIREEKPDMLGISTGGTYTYGFMPFVWAAGGDIATKGGDGSYTAAIDSAESREGIERYIELLSKDVCPPQTCAEMGGNDSVQNFVAGNSAMTIGGNFNLNAVQESEEAGENFAVVPLPGTEPGSVAPAFAGGNNLGVLAGTDRRTLSIEFIQLLAGKEYQQKLYEEMGNLPTLTSVQAGIAESDEQMAPFMETLEAGTKFVPVTPAWATIDAQKVLSSMMQKIASGEASVDDATSKAASQMNEAFADS